MGLRGIAPTPVNSKKRCIQNNRSAKTRLELSSVAFTKTAAAAAASTGTISTRQVVLFSLFLFIGTFQMVDINNRIIIPFNNNSNNNIVENGQHNPLYQQPQSQQANRTATGDIPEVSWEEKGDNTDDDQIDQSLTISPRPVQPKLVFHMIWTETATTMASKPESSSKYGAGTETTTTTTTTTNNSSSKSMPAYYYYTPQMALETICYHHRPRYHHQREKSTAAADSSLPRFLLVTINVYVIGQDLDEIERRMVDELNNTNNNNNTLGCKVLVHDLSSLLKPSSTTSTTNSGGSGGWTTFFHDTPLQEFAQTQQRLLVENKRQQQQQLQHQQDGDKNKKIQMNIQNFKELFRVVTLWKHGGIFVEPDVAWVKPISSFLLSWERSMSSTSTESSSSSSPSSSSYYTYRNTLANTGRSITTGFSSFRPKHPFLTAVMAELTKKRMDTNYDGPYVVQRMVSQIAMDWTDKCPPANIQNGTRTDSIHAVVSDADVDANGSKNDDCLTVLPRYTYYPFSEQRCQMLFEPAIELTEQKVFGNPDLYAVRYFGSKHSGRMMHENSTLYKIYKKGCVLCNLSKSNLTAIQSDARPRFNLLQLAEMNAAANISSMMATTMPAGPTPHTQPQTSLVQWTNLTTMSFFSGRFYSGYRNQMQVFLMLMIEAVDQGYGQFIVDSILMKDTFGSNEYIPFQDLYDVPYWNSFYPQVPRLVLADPLLNPTFDPIKRMPYISKNCFPGSIVQVRECFQNLQSSQTGISLKDLPPSAQSRYMEMKKINQTDDVRLPENSPRYVGVFSHLILRYSRYSRGMLGPIHPVDVVSQKALRPHPDLQAVIDHILDDMKEPWVNRRTASSNVTMMTIHARVEPDMQKHPLCRDQKVYLLKEIVAWTEQLPQFASNPPSFVFLSLAKELLDEEVGVNPNNTIAKDNLSEVQRLLHKGMWNSTVKVYHGYDGVLNGTRYENRTSTTQAMISYYLSLQSDVFIGTPVSSYSQAVAASRFHRDRRLLNYQYLPDGLHDWTPPDLQRPPPFQC